jgi:predicted phage terminase large subunit-like protein
MIVQSWDTASSEKELNDPSACQTFGITPESTYHVLDYNSMRLEYPDLKRAVVEQGNREYAGRKVDAVLIENKSSGIQLIQDLRNSGLPIIPYMPVGEKTVRLSAQSAKIEAGFLFLPEEASWLSDYIVELTTFPAALHDEVGDTLSQFLKWISDRTANAFRIRTV